MDALAALVDQNESTSTKLVSLNLHELVVEDAVRRWPNDAELCCVSCWVLRSVLPAVSHHPDSEGLLGSTTEGVMGLEDTMEGEELGDGGKRDDSGVIRGGCKDQDRENDEQGAEGTLERLTRLAEEVKVGRIVVALLEDCNEIYFSLDRRALWSTTVQGLAS